MKFQSLSVVSKCIIEAINGNQLDRGRLFSFLAYMGLKLTVPRCGYIFTTPSGDCQNELNTAMEIGANILTEKTKIPEDHGFFIILNDSEGNKIAVHSPE